ncbi:unnamed protein product, partial [Hymenolepis diminuta]
QNQALGGSASQVFGSQLQHQTSTRSHGAPQAVTNPNTAIVHQKRSATGEPDGVIDSCPDGGWGWIVVFASFVCMILVEGICLSYSLLVAPICPGNSLRAVAPSTRSAHQSASGVATATSLGIVWSTKARLVPIRPGSCVGVSEMGELLKTQSRLALMAPGGMLMGLYILLGPLASALSNQFDFRPVAMAGGVIATIGLFASAFSTNIAILCITLGGIGGIGFGLIYLPAIATVGHWFKHRRPFVVGLALCGSGVGSIITGQVFPLLISEFTWSGALVILAAFCAQCLVLIVLFRPLDLHLRIKYSQKLRRQAAKEKERQLAAKHRQQRSEKRHRMDRNESAMRAKTQNQAIMRAQATQARAAKKALKAQKAQQRRVIYRGSIMQRIIEEKRRQRTVSIGSLDGMVITRDNELIAAPLVAERPPLLTAASITRISDAVMRKMEARLSAAACPSDGSASAGGETPIRCDSNVSQPSLSRKGSHAGSGLLRLNLVRESLPQLVQDYVQSQASIALQNYMAKQLNQSGGGANFSTPTGTIAATGGVITNPTPDPGMDNITAHSSNSRIRSISNTTSICPTGGNNTPQTQKCLSLRRTISDASITLSNRGGTAIPLEIQQEVAEILDGEVRAEVQHRLRKELMRPQYKKDLFFTGSAQQLDHTPVSAIPLGDAGNLWTKRDQSNWDIGPVSHNPTTAHNVIFTGPNPTTSIRGFNPETDSTTTGTVIIPGNAVTNINSAGVPSSTKVSHGKGEASIMDFEEGEEMMSLTLPQEDRNEEDSSSRKRCGCFSSPIMAFLEELLSPGLLLSPTFIFLLLSNVFTMWGLLVPYLMIPDIVAENNWTLHEAGSIISYIGFANTIGRCIATLYIEKAWSSHYKWLDCLRVNVASLLLAGIACAVLPLAACSYNCIVAMASFFGLFSAIVVSLKSILVVEFFGLDKLTNAFGHMLVVQGLSSIIGAIVGGHIFDVVAARAPHFLPWAGDQAPFVYAAEAAFFFAAGSFLLAAIFAAPLRALSKKETISATFTSTGPGVVAGGGGGVYVDDEFDYGDSSGQEYGSTTVLSPSAMAQINHTDALSGTANNSGSGVNISQLQPATIGSQVASTQLQTSAANQQPSNFDSGIASCVCEHGGVEQPPLPPQTTIPDPPTFLSPAPLPSSLFLTATDSDIQVALPHGVEGDSIPIGGEECGGADGVDGLITNAEIGEVITAAGVPMGNLPIRSVIQASSTPTQNSMGEIWNASPNVNTPSGGNEPIKTTLVAEEPALEPVKEESEEEMEFEDRLRSHSLSSSSPPTSGQHSSSL